MAGARDRVKRGDTATLSGVVGDDAGPMDISGCDEIRVRARSMRTGQPPLLDVLATAGTNRGTWSYKCTPDDLDTAGTYALTVTCHWPDGTRYTFPSQGAEEFVVEDW